MRTLLQGLCSSLRMWCKISTRTTAAIRMLGLGIGGATVVEEIVRLGDRCPTTTTNASSIYSKHDRARGRTSECWSRFRHLRIGSVTAD